MLEIIGKLITPQEGEVSPLFLQLVVAMKKECMYTALCKCILHHIAFFAVF